MSFIENPDTPSKETAAAIITIVFCIIIVVALFFATQRTISQGKDLYEAKCSVGTYQVYRKEYSYYLLENDEKFLPYDNCVFISQSGQQ